MNIEVIIEMICGIAFIIFFIGLIIWAEKDLKKHPELIGKRDKMDPSECL